MSSLSTTWARLCWMRGTRRSSRTSRQHLVPASTEVGFEVELLLVAMTLRSMRCASFRPEEEIARPLAEVGCSMRAHHLCHQGTEDFAMPRYCGRHWIVTAGPRVSPVIARVDVMHSDLVMAVRRSEQGTPSSTADGSNPISVRSAPT